MPPWNRAAVLALGAGLLASAACGVLPRPAELVFGYQPRGPARPSPVPPAPTLPTHLAPAPPDPAPAPKPPQASPPPPPRPLAFLAVLDLAARHHERGVAELGRGNTELADLEFHKALGALMDPGAGTGAALRASFRPLRPRPLPDLPRWEDTPRPFAPAPPPEPEPEETEGTPGEEAPSDAPALITPEDLKAIEQERQPAAAAPQVDPGQFDIPLVVNEKVLAFIHYFSTTKFDLVSRAFERASRYLPMMREIFREKGLPADLLNLAFIESAFNPRARSRAGATGIWQFIESTGRRFGMRSGFWVDERRDPLLSTRGAAEYLKTLYGLFESWPLALAAYNAGEGKIQNAIARQKTADFWKLRLPRETQLFVPAFMAMTIIAKDPARYGFTPPPEQAVEVDVVPLQESVDLGAIARAAGTTPETIRALNPSLLRGVTPPGPFALRLPAGTAAGFLDRLAEVPRPRGARWAHHRVRKGETWRSLARRHKLPVKALLELNGRKAAGPLRAGTRVLVPGRSVPPDAMEPAAHAGPPGAAPGSGTAGSERRYTVLRGDTLGKIAKAHRIRLRELIQLNGLDRRKPLRPGQVLVVGRSPRQTAATAPPAVPDGLAAAPGRPAAAPAQAAPAKAAPQSRVIRYTVKPGDNLWNIAQVHGVSLADLKRWNRLRGHQPLRPGQELKIRPPQPS